MCRPITAVLFLSAARLAAQTHGDLSGYVLDPTGAAVFGAAVAVVNEETGFRRMAFSQPEGAYVVASLRPGTYKLTVRKIGVRTVVRFGVKLEGARATRLDFTLPIGDLTESMFKRNLDVKDFGAIVQGHGGVLDRFDGFLFTLPATYYLTLYLLADRM